MNIRRRLRKIGTQVEIRYVVIVNNNPAVDFDNQTDAFDYIKKYRVDNAIFNLQINRIEIYSL